MLHLPKASGRLPVCRKNGPNWLQQILVGLLILSLTACDKISIPRFAWDEKTSHQNPYQRPIPV